jgi:branched-chain amino acid transport system permease protein
MDGTIFVLLLQDGLTTGAIYLLLAIGLLIVFAVTRVIFIPQGDFVAYGALSMASMLSGKIPGTLWLLDVLALTQACLALWQKKPIHGVFWALLPASLTTIATIASVELGAWPWLLGVLSIAVTALLGPPIYRLTFSLLAHASVLTLLIVAMALHYVLLGIGLIIFGPEASTTPPFSTSTYTIDGIDVSGHSLWVAASCAALVVVLRWLFRFTNAGRAMRATASNPLGARLMGIDAGASARKAFLLACAIGALGGLLIAPLTPISYDSGFLMGLKGFIAAVIGGLASYPIAAAGALCVGVIESLSSFWASSYSNPIVFGLLIPALAILSLRPGTIED